MVAVSAAPPAEVTLIAPLSVDWSRSLSKVSWSTSAPSIRVVLTCTTCGPDDCSCSGVASMALTRNELPSVDGDSLTVSSATAVGWCPAGSTISSTLAETVPSGCVAALMM